MGNKALLLMDFINEIVDENGKFAGMGYPAFVKEHGVIANCNAAIAKARTKGIPVIFVRVGFSADYREWPAGSPILGGAKEFGAIQLGTWATEFHKDLDVQEQDYIVTKHRVSALHGTNLDLILRKLKVDTILMGGVGTDLVVQSTARAAHDMDYSVEILTDCCGDTSQEVHEAALTSLGSLAKVTTSAESAHL